MRCFCLFALAILAAIISSARADEPAKPVRPDKRLIIVSLDGLRPDLALRANTPTLRSLMERGTYTLWAHTTPFANTLPSHTSMLTGQTIEKHGLDFNDARSLETPVYPKVPTIFSLARAAGYSTAMVAGKGKFSSLALPGSLDWVWVPQKGVTDDEEVLKVASLAYQLQKPQVMFVHFPGIDTAGHANGWGSPQQIKTIESVDAKLGAFLEVVKAEGLLDKTVIIVSADHGGSGKTHGKDNEPSKFIPWIIAGPGIVAGQDLTTGYRDLTVRTYDTFATACHILGLSPGDIDGKPIVEATIRTELMQSDASGPAR